MSDYTFTIALGIIAAILAYLGRPPKDSKALKIAQKRADDLADAKADAATEDAQTAHDKAAEKAHSETTRIDRADLEELSKMVDYEYGSD